MPTKQCSKSKEQLKEGEKLEIDPNRRTPVVRTTKACHRQQVTRRVVAEKKALSDGNIALPDIEKHDDTTNTSGKKERFRGSFTDNSFFYEDDVSSSDTDLELEDGDKNSKKKHFDTSGRRVYEIACKRHSMIASSKFMRQLRDEKLNMSKAGLKACDMQVMTYPVAVNTLVSELDFSDNSIGGEGASLLCQGLLENVSIHTLNIARNCLGTVGAEHICALLCENNEIRDLDVSGNGFRESDARFFAEALPNNFKLKRLNLSNNEFREQGGEILAKGIVQNDTIEELDLSWNHLRLKGGRAVGNCLRNNQGIKILNLAWNGFSNDGAFYIAASLKTNSTLLELDLTCNRITIEGAAFLYGALTVNDTLQVLKLGLNPITTVGVTKLLHAIRSNHNSAITMLEMADIPVTYTVGALVAEIQARQPTFDLFHGGYVATEDVYAKRFAEKYEVNPFFLLLTYIREQGFRLLDLFSQFDNNKDWNISRAEFIKGLQMARIPLTQGQLEKLLDQLDKDNNGTVDFGEFIRGEKEFRMKQRRKQRLRQQLEGDMFEELNTPRPESAENVRGGKLPNVIRARSPKPFSRDRKQQTPTMEGNFLDIVISAKNNKTQVEGRPKSATASPRYRTPSPRSYSPFSDGTLSPLFDDRPRASSSPSKMYEVVMEATKQHKMSANNNTIITQDEHENNKAITKRSLNTKGGEEISTDNNNQKPTQGNKAHGATLRKVKSPNYADYVRQNSRRHSVKDGDTLTLMTKQSYLSRFAKSVATPTELSPASSVNSLRRGKFQ